MPPALTQLTKFSILRSYFPRNANKIFFTHENKVTYYEENLLFIERGEL
jgi:hypothetical protein